MDIFLCGYALSKRKNCEETLPVYFASLYTHLQIIIPSEDFTGDKNIAFDFSIATQFIEFTKDTPAEAIHGVREKAVKICPALQR